jgi:hypothetical protein
MFSCRPNTQGLFDVKTRPAVGVGCCLDEGAVCRR